MDYDILNGQVKSAGMSIWWVSFMLSPEMADWSDSKIMRCMKDYITQSRVWVGQYQTKQRWCFSMLVKLSSEQILRKGGFVETLAIEETARLVDSWIAEGRLPYQRQRFFGLS